MYGAVRVVLVAPSAQYVVEPVEGVQLRQVAGERLEGSGGKRGLAGVEAVDAVGRMNECEVESECKNEEECDENEEDNSSGMHGELGTELVVGWTFNDLHGFVACRCWCDEAASVLLASQLCKMAEQANMVLNDLGGGAVSSADARSVERR